MPGRLSPVYEILAILFAFVCCLCFVSIFSDPNDELSLLCCVLETVIIVKADMICFEFNMHDS